MCLIWMICVILERYCKHLHMDYQLYRAVHLAYPCTDLLDIVLREHVQYTTCYVKRLICYYLTPGQAPFPYFHPSNVAI